MAVKRINEGYNAEKTLTMALLRDVMNCGLESSVVDRIEEYRQLLLNAGYTVEKICYYIMNNFKTKNTDKVREDLNRSMRIYEDLNDLLEVVVYYCKRCKVDNEVSQENLRNIEGCLNRIDWDKSRLDPLYDAYVTSRIV